MSLRSKQFIVGFLGLLFLASLIFVQWMEVTRKQVELGVVAHPVSIPASSKSCVECHDQSSPGIIDHWEGSTHAVKGIGCVECHIAEKGDIDGFDHYGAHIATIVTPKGLWAMSQAGNRKNSWQATMRRAATSSPR